MDDSYKKSGGDANWEGMWKYALIVGGLVILAIGLSALANFVGNGNCKGILLGPSKDTCMFALALSSNNYSMCKSLTGSQDAQCYLQISENTGNSSLCRNASKYSSAWGNQCYLYFENKTGSASYCSGVIGTEHGSCLAASAIYNYNLSYCADISNFTQSSSCAQAVSMNSALRSDNASYCAALSGTYSSNETLYLLSSLDGAVKANASGLYSESTPLVYMQGSAYLKSDICYLFFSTLVGSTNYCSMITNSGIGAICSSVALNRFPVASPSNSTHSNSTNSTAYYSTLINECSNQSASIFSLCSNAVLLMEALQTKNATICSHFSGALNAQCFEGLAKEYGNATYCGYISNSTYDYSCVIGTYGTNATSG